MTDETSFAFGCRGVDEMFTKETMPTMTAAGMAIARTISVIQVSLRRLVTVRCNFTTQSTLLAGAAYSDRSDSTGSARVARHAGIRPAAAAATRSSADIEANTRGSRGDVSYS